MSQNFIDRVLAGRPAVAGSPAPSAAEDDDKFFSILVGEPVQEQFLELRFNSGMRTCASYADLAWFNYDPESGTLDLEFGVFMVTVRGRGLGAKVFDGIKQKRLAWLMEASSEMQDHKGNAIFIEAITITPPSAAADQAAA